MPVPWIRSRIGVDVESVRIFLKKTCLCWIIRYLSRQFWNGSHDFLEGFGWLYKVLVDWWLLFLDKWNVWRDFYLDLLFDCKKRYEKYSKRNFRKKPIQTEKHFEDIWFRAIRSFSMSPLLRLLGECQGRLIFDFLPRTGEPILLGILILDSFGICWRARTRSDSYSDSYGWWKKSG